MIVTLTDVAYAYPGTSLPALRDVSFELRAGSFTLVAGPSAGGKSTLLRLLNGLVPQFHGGRLTGAIRVAGFDPTRTPTRRLATLAGMVFQEPEAQAVTDSVDDEIAFGMEQQGLPPKEMRQRIDALLASCGIDHLRGRRLATLSGGERQRVAIAAVLALEPRLLLLDEPTSQLDQAGAEAVLGVVAALHRKRGLTVLAAEHRLERLLPVVDAVLGVDNGRVEPMAPRVAAAHLRAVPPVCDIGRRLQLQPLPLSLAEARAALAARHLTSAARPRPAVPGDELLRVEGLIVRYGAVPALANASFSLPEGEIVALMGANGSGKSTLLRAIAGLVPATSGQVFLRGRAAPPSVQARTVLAGLVPQDPAVALYRDTVRDEIAETLRHRHLARPADRVLERWGLAELADRNPRDLSVGQQQRAAIGAMLAHEPSLWLLDEPTRGVDAAARDELAARLRAHAAAGGAALVATHDVESAARYATRVVGLQAGLVRFDMLAAAAFHRDGPVPTQAARLVPGAILPEDVLLLDAPLFSSPEVAGGR
ncbi:MAG: ATP-binding cassette domain-containing protein [Dehalococcoidia bacterium]|nr:ATP-binding cassette domain-containing protein [Dehalococcoidia bacterium]